MLKRRKNGQKIQFTNPDVLTFWRVKCGLSISEAEAQSNLPVSLYENGDKIPDGAALRKLTNLYDCGIGLYLYNVPREKRGFMDILHDIVSRGRR